MSKTMQPTIDELECYPETVTIESENGPKIEDVHFYPEVLEVKEL